MKGRTIRIPWIPPAHEVTTVRDGAEVSPRDVGLAPDAPERIWDAVARLYATGTQPAIALCIRRHGQVVLDRTMGHSHGNAPGDLPSASMRLATPDTPFCIFSASKAVTAMLVHHLDDRGVLHIDDRVVEYIPEFGRHGKERITLRHVLTHRAGIPAVGDAEQLDLLLDPDHIVELLCEARPDHAAGRRVAYHAISGGFVLGEVVRRVTGKDIRQVLHEEFLAPLGFEGMNYGWPADRLDEVAHNAFTGRPAPPGVSHLVRRALGVSLAEAPALANSEAWLTSIVPSGNIVATADEACRFFQMLLDEGTLDGTRVMDARTVRRATTETAYLELDLTMMLPVRYGVGLMLGAEHAGIFGPRTAHAFGHLGFTNIFCWADPDRALAVSLLTSGKALVSRHLLALGRLLRTISKTCPTV